MIKPPPPNALFQKCNSVPHAIEWLLSNMDRLPPPDMSNQNVNDGNPLYRTSENGHTEVVKALLAAKDIDVNCANPSASCTPPSSIAASKQG